ncbi:RDD family protein [Aurantiacibacter atlanticus]|uniref:RDD family protein n=1 Tax=Aurantiacibacter atlanticus TaxID=1648404 RepID=A0A0H4VWH2_9SPHN|nr:RDD family protein [Aurantiacibacter atlanticus]AKQ41423.1 RDD family protein [Aurantiacibacter atlanticus]MDF1833911.1 RDD family protein [Alteraurantiacibacter sp. bin_em_oilr2.035]
MSGQLAALRRDPDKRDRMLVTPEGLALPLTVGSRGARAAALLLDLIIITIGVIVFFMALAGVGIGLFQLETGFIANPVLELVIVLVVLLLFLARYGYFLWFELGPRAATPGKRLLGLRVAARDGGRLTAEMVIARNLVRDVEVFLPLFFLLGGMHEAGISGAAAGLWLAVFVLFPFCNRDALRAGDLVAGTWVVEAKSAKLKEAMSLAPDRSTEYRFGEAELSVYGEHELQVLERVLRQDQTTALRDVAEAIATKIGWQIGRGDEREFLEAFYAALRGHLESGMRFGRRKRNKHS